MRWTYKPEPNLKKTALLAKELGVTTVIAKILVQRGIETFEEAKNFFRPNLDNLHDPFLMKDMKKAVDRIEKALKNKENILVYGDYDVDGTTSVALVSKYLKTKQENIGTYVPDRNTEGYGISFQSIDFAYDNGFSLVIALDCGIKAIDKIAYANKKGVDFVICDHHTPGEILPAAIAVLDPKRKDCNYPYKELSGCGVGFKLLQALQQNQGIEVASLIPYLDLVATSIAADIVPMTGENRVLCYHGLKVINENPSVGIQALKATFDKETLNITDVVFGIAPRINAAGRLKHAHFSVELLIEQDKDKAREMAASLNEVNTQRKDLDKKITQEALSQIKLQNKKDPFTTVVYDENWHKGVIGIVASRLIETYYRPTIVFTKNGDFLTASARSVKGFNIYDALQTCDSYIEQWGGHKYAAGLSIKPENFDSFKKEFEKVVKETIKPECRLPEIRVDSEIFLSDVTLKFHRILEQMAPFGPGNMHPVFSASGLRDNGMGKRVGADKSHLKLSILEGSNPKTYNGIAFGLGELFSVIQKPFKTIFTIDENHWNGTTSIQLKIKDIKQE
ncbi:MAG TPA: single-stranded-DNA-specific exonuclease RecJ [Lutibacter sp.]|nr:single-stranded-DNA-specific exonuclease RecJ [Lutibacter sp.]